MKNLPDNSITYLGRTFKTSITKPLTDEEYQEIIAEREREREGENGEE